MSRSCGCSIPINFHLNTTGLQFQHAVMIWRGLAAAMQRFQTLLQPSLRCLLVLLV